ncbi:MAG TPA: flavodoxin family protein [bacterium]|nr:flavodoxin family protein [bacterium]
MKIMTVLGSPKMDGNTAGALAMLERELGAAHDIDRINLPELDVMGCQGCYECQKKPNEASCVVRDGATDVLKRIVDADAIVYASPLFMWGFASKIHAFMERHLSLVTGYMTPQYVSLVEGKKAALLLTCGGPVEGNTEAIQQVFDGFTGYAKANLVGKYIVAGTTTPDEIESKAGDIVKKMAADLVG